MAFELLFLYVLLFGLNNGPQALTQEARAEA